MDWTQNLKKQAKKKLGNNRQIGDGTGLKGLKKKTRWEKDNNSGNFVALSSRLSRVVQVCHLRERLHAYLADYNTTPGSLSTVVMSPSSWPLDHMGKNPTNY